MDQKADCGLFNGPEVSLVYRGLWTHPAEAAGDREAAGLGSWGQVMLQ